MRDKRLVMKIYITVLKSKFDCDSDRVRLHRKIGPYSTSPVVVWTGENEDRPKFFEQFYIKLLTLI